MASLFLSENMTSRVPCFANQYIQWGKNKSSFNSHLCNINYSYMMQRIKNIAKGKKILRAWEDIWKETNGENNH